LIALAKRGDVPAYEALVLRYQTLAFRTAYLITGDAGEAEDASQTAFVKAWKAIDRFEFEPARRRFGRPRRSATEDPTEPSFRPWLLTIVANEARNRVRSESRHPTIELNDAIDHPLANDTESPEAVVESNERRAELMHALEQLSVSDRTVISMRYFLDLSEQEMAAALGIPPGTVKSRLSRALQRVRVHLDEMNAEAKNRETADD
jgi:RNA polymerase sigma-70 factor (ECF subfamily)